MVSISLRTTVGNKNRQFRVPGHQIFIKDDFTTYYRRFKVDRSRKTAKITLFLGTQTFTVA